MVILHIEKIQTEQRIFLVLQAMILEKGGILMELENFPFTSMRALILEKGEIVLGTMGIVLETTGIILETMGITLENVGMEILSLAKHNLQM